MYNEIKFKFEQTQKEKKMKSNFRPFFLTGNILNIVLAVVITIFGIVALTNLSAYASTYSSLGIDVSTLSTIIVIEIVFSVLLATLSAFGLSRSMKSVVKFGKYLPITIFVLDCIWIIWGLITLNGSAINIITFILSVLSATFIMIDFVRNVMNFKELKFKEYSTKDVVNARFTKLFGLIASITIFVFELVAIIQYSIEGWQYANVNPGLIVAALIGAVLVVMNFVIFLLARKDEVKSKPINALLFSSIIVYLVGIIAQFWSFSVFTYRISYVFPIGDFLSILAFIAGMIIAWVVLAKNTKREANMREAALIGGVTVQPVETKRPAVVEDIDDEEDAEMMAKLRKLKKLYDAKLITEADYTKLKNEILKKQIMG